MAYLNKVTLPSGTKQNLEGTIYLVKGTQSAATNAWTGACKLDELKDGTTIAYYLPYAGTTSAATLNLTLADGSTTTGAKSIYFTGTTAVKQQFGAGSLILMTYDGTAWHTNNYIDHTYTVPTAYTSNPANVSTTASAGSSTQYSKGDHVHAISLATGDSNGQVKIAGQNVTVKNINNAAYKDVDTSISAGSTSTKLPTSAAVASFVSEELGKLDALRFMGTIGTGGTVTTLPTDNVKVGDTYRVITAGTYSGMVVEVGDLIIATATTPTWTVAQANIDGAVTGPSSAVENNFASFNGTTGTVIKDSGYTVSTGNSDTTATHVVLCNDSRLSDTRTPKSHTHGNIQNGGTLQTTDVDIASGDKLVVTDSSNSNKVARTSTSFDGSTEKKALTPKGSWKEFLQTVNTTGSGNVVTAVAVNGTDASQLDVTKGITALTSHQTIKQDGVTGATASRYATCSIAAGTAAKTATITSGTFSLEAGARIIVKFANANTASSPTLNVYNSSTATGAKNIFYNGAQITSGANKALLRGTCEFIYDGTQYHLVGPGANVTSGGLASGWSAGSTPTLGTAIPADDITAWTPNTPTAVTLPTFTVADEMLTITAGSVTAGSAASLSYTAKSIPNVTSVGSAPSLTVTTKNVLTTD